MAVPDTNTFSLQDVVNEVNPTTDDLVDCIADAISSKYDANYYFPPATSLYEFRNYGASALSVTNIGSSTNTGTNYATSLSCNLNISSGDTLAILIVCKTTNSANQPSISDTEGATWTHVISKINGTDTHRIDIYTCSDLADLGSRTISASFSSAIANMCAISLTGSETFATARNSRSGTSSEAYTTQTVDSGNLVFTGFMIRNAANIYGSNQVEIYNDSSSASGGTVNNYGSATYKIKTTTDSQSETNYYGSIFAWCAASISVAPA